MKQKMKLFILGTSLTLLMTGCLPIRTKENKEPEKNEVKPISGNVWDSRKCLDWDKADFPLDDRKLSQDERVELIKKSQHLIPGVDLTSATDYYLIDEKTKTLNTDLVENYRMCGEKANQDKSHGYNDTYGLNSEKNRVITEIFKRGYDITGSKVTDDEMKQALPAVKSWIEGYVRQALNRENATINLDALDYREKGETSAYVTVNAVGDIPKFQVRFPLYMDVLSSNPTHPKIVGEPDVETDFKSNMVSALIQQKYPDDYKRYNDQLAQVKEKYGLEILMSGNFPYGISHVGTHYHDIFPDFVNKKPVNLEKDHQIITMWLFVKDKKEIVDEAKFNEIFNDLTKGLEKTYVRLSISSNYYINKYSHSFWFISKDSIERRKKLV